MNTVKLVVGNQDLHHFDSLEEDLHLFGSLEVDLHLFDSQEEDLHLFGSQEEDLELLVVEVVHLFLCCDDAMVVRCHESHVVVVDSLAIHCKVNCFRMEEERREKREKRERDKG